MVGSQGGNTMEFLTGVILFILIAKALREHGLR
jgi:hypothetical protein